MPAAQGGIQSHAALICSSLVRPDSVRSFPPAAFQVMGLDIMGDERQQGPAYNYARVFTWFQVSTTMLTAVKLPVVKIKAEHQPSPGAADPDGDVVQAAQLEDAD